MVDIVGHNMDLIPTQKTLGINCGCNFNLRIYSVNTVDPHEFVGYNISILL
jgi:hypothetical protein